MIVNLVRALKKCRKEDSFEKVFRYALFYAMTACLIFGSLFLSSALVGSVDTAKATEIATPSQNTATTTTRKYSGGSGSGMSTIAPGYMYMVPVYDQSKVIDVGEVLRNVNKNNQVSLGKEVKKSYFAKSKKLYNMQTEYKFYLVYYQALIREQTSLIYVPQNEASLIFLPYATIYTKNNNSIVNRSYLP
jgi:hypothetical protein